MWPISGTGGTLKGGLQQLIRPCNIQALSLYPYPYNIMLCTQVESRFRQELGMVNVTVASRMFGTRENPIETEDLFVSCIVHAQICLLNCYAK